jgi:hypothetical protein
LGSAPETKAAEEFCITNQRAAPPGLLDKPRFAPVGLVQRLCASLSPNILRLSAVEILTERTHLVAGVPVLDVGCPWRDFGCSITGNFEDHP